MADVPTMLFLGVRTSGSLSMDVFPHWVELLGIERCQLCGVDLPVGASPERYRAVIGDLAADPLVRGALVTTHKLDLFAACSDRFATIGELATIMREVSSISKREDKLVAHARDPVASERALRSFLPDDHWQRTRGEALIIGAGGAATAISWTLRIAHSRENGPAQVTVTDVSPERLRAIEAVHAHAFTEIPFNSVLIDGNRTNEELVGRLPAGSLIVNATGLGKDAPGSPLATADAFPDGVRAWDLNYRGDLTFAEQARSMGIVVEDGLAYFVHGWLAVIADVFDRDVPTSGAGLEPFREVAHAVQAERSASPGAVAPATLTVGRKTP